MDAIYRDEYNDYRVTLYMGNDPAKKGLYHVAKIDGHYNAHTATPTKMNPWTTQEEATKNLHAMAKHHGWEPLRRR